jgi:hypothetical protein
MQEAFGKGEEGGRLARGRGIRYITPLVFARSLRWRCRFRGEHRTCKARTATSSRPEHSHRR